VNCHKDGFSSQNSIFDSFLLDKKLVIHSFQEALALSVPVPVDFVGRKTTIRLLKKLRSDATKSHYYAVSNPDNDVLADQSKAIQQ